MEFGLSVVYFLSKLPEKLTLWKVWMLLDGTEVSILNFNILLVIYKKNQLKICIVSELKSGN